MNIRTTYVLLAILTAVGTMTVSGAYAIPSEPISSEMEARDAATKVLRADLPVSVWTDKSAYGHNDTIMVKGMVANIASGSPVTLTVTNPLQNIVTIDQLTVNSDGSFETNLNTAGSLWKFDGTYTIRVQYGPAEKSNWTLVELTGGVTSKPTTPTAPSTRDCTSAEVSADGYCIPYSISGGMITGASINSNDNSIVISISSTDDGTLTVTPSRGTLDGIFMVLVDGEEWDDYEKNDQKVTVMFPAGAEEIEIIGTFVVPEFGTIAALVLAVAIISIIAVSARSRLSIMPRY